MSPGPGVSGGWAGIASLFHRALELPEPEREAFLARECAERDELRARVRRLLDAHDAADRSDGAGTAFLETLDPMRAAVLLEDADAGPAPGEHVHRYRIERLLGRGAAGVVHLAHDPLLDRRVALKLLRSRPGDRSPCGGDEGRRLLEEARAASALDHPRVGTIFEVGEAEDGRVFIAMACYEGGSLRARMHQAEEAPAPAEVARLGAEVADGLAAAHERDVVHRDVKPENLVFDERGGVKIVDFGIASSARFREGRSGGTPAYASPEQLRGDRVDGRSDLWSLGVVLYELLARQRPFGSRGAADVLAAAEAGDRTPLRELRPDAPARLVELVERCLDPDPAGRPGSAHEVARTLREIAEERRERATRDRRRLALVAAGWFAGSWALLELAGIAADRFLLPGWVRPGLALLLLAGLPAVLAADLPAGGRAPGREGGEAAGGALRAALRLVTWPRALAGGGVGLAILVLAAVLVTAGGWPRITDARGSAGDAFAERTSIVVADFGVSEETAELGAAAREALVVDLLQSGYVEVLGWREVSEVLERMGRSAEDALDLPLALEVAERAGAGAVLAASVARVGDQYLLAGRAVETASGQELFGVRTAAGPDRLLGAVERLSREMRRRLGEGREELSRSLPLPDVTTPSLEALRLYAEAERAAVREPDRATALVEEALRADPDFAMAHRLAGALATGQLLFGKAKEHLSRARELGDRLPERERRHVEAFHLATVEFDFEAAAEHYELLLSRYPADARAANNLGVMYDSWLGDRERGAEAYLRALEIDPTQGVALNNAAFSLLVEREAESDSLTRLAEAAGFEGFRERWEIARAFSAEEYAGVVAGCEALLARELEPAPGADDREVCGSMDVAMGRLQAAAERLAAVEIDYERSGRYRNLAHAAQGRAAAHLQLGEIERASELIESVVERAPAEGFIEPDRFITRVNLRVQAELAGRPGLSARIAAAYPPHPEPDHWFARMGEGLVEAAAAVRVGDGGRALEVLRGDHPDSGPQPIGWRIWSELLRAAAFEAEAQPDSAAARFRRAADPRFHPLPGLSKDRIHLPVALEGLVRAEEARGDTAGARAARARLERLRAGADPEAEPR